MKFKIGEVIIRHRRKESRTVLAYENGHYILSDSKNGLGQSWWNRHQVETQFKLSGEGI